jgi:Caspase domain
VLTLLFVRFAFASHGCGIPDKNNEEYDGKDEALCPIDYNENGLITDDYLFDNVLKHIPEGAHLTWIMDCCHSGSILDLPYAYKADGEMEGMALDPMFDFKKLFYKLHAEMFSLEDDEEEEGGEEEEEGGEEEEEGGEEEEEEGEEEEGGEEEEEEEEEE